MVIFAILAPLVFAAAKAGDGVALALVRTAGRALGCQVVAVAVRLGLGPEAALSGTGGVLREIDALWPSLAAAARHRLPALIWRQPLLPPVVGAALLARRSAGLPVSADLASSLRGQVADLHASGM